MQENGTDFPATIKWSARKATDRAEGTEGEGRRHSCVPPKAPFVDGRGTCLPRWCVGVVVFGRGKGPGVFLDVHRYSILHSLGPQKTRNTRHVQSSFTFYKHIHSDKETSKIQRSHVTVRVHDEQAHSIDPVTHQLRKCFCVWTGIFPMYIHSVLSFKYDTVPLHGVLLVMPCLSSLQ